MNLLNEWASGQQIDSEAIAARLHKELNMAGMPTVRQYVRMDAGLAPSKHEDGEEDPEDMDELVQDWCETAVQDAFGKIDWLFKGGKITVWREITAPANWTPESGHPGIYWSWDEDAAEAHWGTHKDGEVKWLMMAEVTPAMIDWPATLCQNANPDYEDEKEIRLLPNVPVKVSKVWNKG